MKFSGYAQGAWAAAWVCTAACAAQPGDAPVAFDIPAQPLAAALNTWAVQANAQVFVDPGPVAHLMAPSIKGNFPPRQALRALLAHSNLQIITGADGVLVIRPRPAVVAAPKPVTPPPEPSVGVSPAPTPAPILPRTALATEGRWLLRLDGAYIQSDGTGSGGATATAGAEYFFTDRVTGAISVTAPRTVSFVVPGAPGSRASTRAQSTVLGLKYYLAPDAPLRPYVGAGIDISSFYDTTGGGLERATVGPDIQAGADLRLAAHWMLNVSVSWAQARPDIRLDPLQWGLGVVYRFGTERR